MTYEYEPRDRTVPEIGERIRKRRKAAGMSQWDVALKMDVSTWSVASWENGRRHPEAASVAQLAKAMKCSTDYLLLGRNAAKYEKTEET